MDLSTVDVKNLDKKGIEELKRFLDTLSEDKKAEFALGLLDSFELDEEPDDNVKEIFTYVKYGEEGFNGASEKIDNELEPDVYSLFDLTDIVKELRKEVDSLRKELNELKSVYVI